jgi:hypothetical protein
MALTEKYVSALAAGGGDGSSGSPFTWAEMVTEINAGSAAGIRYNVKGDGTYSLSSSTTISGSGTLASPIIIRGYKTTIGDGYLGRNSNGALISTNMPSIVYDAGFSRLNVSGSYIILETLNISSNTTGTLAHLVTIQVGSVIKSCIVTNPVTSSAGGGVNLNGVAGVCFDCDIYLTGTSGGVVGVTTATQDGRVLSTRIGVSSPAGTGINVGHSNTLALNTIYGTDGIGVYSSSAIRSPALINNTIVGFGTGVLLERGINILQCMVNNLITDSSGYAFNLVTGASFISNTRIRNNTHGYQISGSDWFTGTMYNVISGAGARTVDYTDPSSNNYGLTATSPAVNAGAPASLSIGALQRNQSGVSSSTVVVNFIQRNLPDVRI